MAFSSWAPAKLVESFPGDSILVGFLQNLTLYVECKLGGWDWKAAKQGLGDREYTEEGYCVPKERKA